MTRKAGNGISRGLKPVSSAGGIGLPRLKPGPISEAKANAGVLRYAQDDKRETGNRRFLRQAQDRLFDCATHDETVSHSAQDDSVKQATAYPGG